MPGSFVHLHNHTEYSLLDGAVHIKAVSYTHLDVYKRQAMTRIRER